MAVVPQETQLAFDFTVLEVVLMGRYPHLGAFEIEGPADIAHRPRRAARHRARSNSSSGRSRTLSGGEKQRVIIAAALAQIGGRTRSRRTSLLLDEPTAALDLGYQLEIAALLTALHREPALTVVVSTHDLNFAAAMCQTLVLLARAAGPGVGRDRRVLTPEHVRALYGVEADVRLHAAAGHLVVVPVRADRKNRPSMTIRRRVARSPSRVFGAARRRGHRAGAARRVHAI